MPKRSGAKPALPSLSSKRRQTLVPQRRRSLRVAAQLSAAHLPPCIVSGRVQRPPDILLDSANGHSLSGAPSNALVRGERPSAAVMLLTDRDPYAAVGQPVYLRVGVRCQGGVGEADLVGLWKEVVDFGWGVAGEGEDLVIGLIGFLEAAGIDGRGRGYGVGHFCLLRRCERLLEVLEAGDEVESFRKEASEGRGVEALIVWRDSGWELRGMRSAGEKEEGWWESLTEDGIKERAPAGRRVRKHGLQEQIDMGWKSIEEGRFSEAAIQFTLGLNALRVISSFEDVAWQAALRCGRATAAFELGNFAAAVSDARIVRQSSIPIGPVDGDISNLTLSYAIHRIRAQITAGNAYEQLNRPWQAYSSYSGASLPGIGGTEVLRELGEADFDTSGFVKVIEEGLDRLSEFKCDPTYIVKVELRGLDPAQPPIWRRIAVPGRISLWLFHQVLQIALGLNNVHPHVFVDCDGTFYSHECNEWTGPSNHEDLTYLLEVLQEPGDTLSYSYGPQGRAIDRWNHRITLESLRRSTSDRGETPVVLAGSGATLPDEIGGPSAYYEFLRLLKGEIGKQHIYLLPDFMTTPRDALQWAYSAASATNCGPCFDVEALPSLKSTELESSFEAARCMYPGIRRTRSGLRGQLLARRRGPICKRRTKKSGKEKLSVTCVICSEDISEGTLLPCGHAYFHRECIRRWFMESLSCPVCRADMQHKLGDLISWDPTACHLDRINSALAVHASEREEAERNTHRFLVELEGYVDPREGIWY